MTGGAGTENTKLILEKAVLNAKAHGINLHAGVENLANGNCAFETVIDSINTRVSFEESLGGTPHYWRQIWMTEVETVAFDNWNRGLTKDQWPEAWDSLK